MYCCLGVISILTVAQFDEWLFLYGFMHPCMVSTNDQAHTRGTMSNKETHAVENEWWLVACRLQVPPTKQRRNKRIKKIQSNGAKSTCFWPPPRTAGFHREAENSCPQWPWQSVEPVVFLHGCYNVNFMDGQKMHDTWIGVRMKYWSAS